MRWWKSFREKNGPRMGVKYSKLENQLKKLKSIKQL